ncbi:glutamate receptor 2.7-like [Hibiscus syriacus]|uniref:glutamate receptor 2.7-like n=1 Tax=Hibiscus syriacus TaxID=106335 RepID=UPI0019229FAD|nr:glutamate receptor 2.7-like [Hibiscus syriacus]
MPKHVWFSFLLLVFFSFFSAIKSDTGGLKLVHNIGVDSKTVNICMSMALSDFYAEHQNSRTRLSPPTWDSLAAPSPGNAVGHLPQASAEASFAIELRDSSSPSASPFLIRTSTTGFSRLAEATVSTLEMFEWNRVVFIYEDMEFSNAIIPYLADALKNNGIQLSHRTAIPTSAQSSQILKQLEPLMTLQSTVFVVMHMSTDLASRFFAVANEAGLMSKGFAWLVTFVDAMDHVAIDSMEGVIGLRPYVPNTKALKNFRTRYKRLSMMMQNKEATELNLFGLRVYDIFHGLAMSVERMNGSWLMGMLNTSYRGISGDFELVNGQIQPSVFEIFNVTKKGQRMIGYCTHDRGISKNLYPNSRHTRRTLEANESIESKWIIGVPSKSGFKEFVNIQPWDKKVDEREPGFTIEVFKAVWESLGLPPNGYEFKTMDGTYDELVAKLMLRKSMLPWRHLDCVQQVKLC